MTRGGNGDKWQSNARGRADRPCDTHVLTVMLMKVSKHEGTPSHTGGILAAASNQSSQWVMWTEPPGLQRTEAGSRHRTLGGEP